MVPPESETRSYSPYHERRGIVGKCNEGVQSSAAKGSMTAEVNGLVLIFKDVTMISRLGKIQASAITAVSRCTGAGPRQVDFSWAALG